MTNFKHVSPGQSLNAITAEEWNWLMDLRRRNRPGVAGVNNANESNWPYYHRVRVRNVTGDAIQPSYIVGLGDPEVLPAANLVSFKRTPIFGAQSPALASHWRLWAVSITEIAENQLGWVGINGIMPVRASIVHAAHDRVRPAEGVTANLVSDFAGTGRILWKEPGTGTKWCWVEFHREESRVLKGVLDEDLVVDGTATMSVWRDGAPVGTNVEVTLNWAHGGQNISAGKELMVRWFPDELNWVPFVAECED